MSTERLMTRAGAWSQQPAPYFNANHTTRAGRGAVGSTILLTLNHTQRQHYYRTQYYAAPYIGVTAHRETPRILLDRDVFKFKFSMLKHTRYSPRWEKIVNGKRTEEDRYALVEEDGAMHKVNWKLYSDRINAELQATVDALPCFTLRMEAVPMQWRKLDIAAARIRGLSLREAMAQCKLSSFKGHGILYRALERALHGAENKGLDKDHLRVTMVSCASGPRDKQIDIRSRGYYGWRTKRSTHLMLTLTEDPELTLPDRSTLPVQSQLNLQRAGIPTTRTTIDIPAITADGI